MLDLVGSDGFIAQVTPNSCAVPRIDVGRKDRPSAMRCTTRERSRSW